MKNFLLFITCLSLTSLLNGQVNLELKYVFSNSIYANGYLADSSGNGNDADIVNMSTLSDGYTANVAENLTFGDYSLPVHVIQMDSLNVIAKAYTGISGASPRTIMTWIKTDTTNEVDGIIVTYGATKANRFEMAVSGTTKTMRFNNKTSEFVSEVKVKQQEWFHFATTYDGTTMRYFIDGVRIDSGDIALNTASEATAIVGGFGSGKKFFKGFMYDFRMYSGAMSESDIMDVIEETMQIGVGIEEKNLQSDDLIRVFPNPAHGHLSLSGTSHESFKIIDISGKEILSGRFEESSSINIEKIDRGIYILRLDQTGRSYKFIKE